MKQDQAMSPGDVIEWSDHKSEVHRWRVRGVHLGPPGVESLIEIENVSHAAGWTGQWETHVMMFVPEVLLRGLNRTKP